MRIDDRKFQLNNNYYFKYYWNLPEKSFSDRESAKFKINSFTIIII